MDSASTRSATLPAQHPHRRRLCVLALLALCAATAATLAHSRAQTRTQLADLERQLVLARDSRNTAAVGEIARRIVRLDSTPDRLLAVSESLLQARRFGDLEAALATAQRRAPQHAAAILRLRARAEAARPNFAASIALWDEYLAVPDLAPADRITALDDFSVLLAAREEWSRARSRIDERLALADAPAARLLRAHIAVRQRDWATARADFLDLKTGAASAPGVRDHLPAWERIERSLPQLQACDTALAASSAPLRHRLERALLCARLGLWQNAGDDLARAAKDAPGARLPGLLARTLGLPPTFAQTRPPEDAEPLASVPWLVASTPLANYLDTQQDIQPLWQQLIDVEAQLLEANSAAAADLRAARAGLIRELGFAEIAAQEAHDILKKNPAHIATREVLIAALLACGEVTEAASALEQTSALLEETDAATPEFERLSGLVRQAQGRHAEAVEAFGAYLARQPERADIHRARAASLRRLQRFAEAAQDLAEAERLEAAAAQGGAQ